MTILLTIIGIALYVNAGFNYYLVLRTIERLSNKKSETVKENRLLLVFTWPLLITFINGRK